MADTEDRQQLYSFYQVTNDDELIKAQEDHIVSLQKRLSEKKPWEQSFPPSKVREG